MAARGQRTTPTTTGRPETVDGTYSNGKGFEAGNIAPSSKFRTVDGEIVDELPAGEGGWSVVIEGDVVTPAAARELADASNGGDTDDES